MGRSEDMVALSSSSGAKAPASPGPGRHPRKVFMSPSRRRRRASPEWEGREVITVAALPGRGLYVVDAQHADPAAYAGWLAATRPIVTRYLRGPAA